jgi:hypothetical protein
MHDPADDAPIIDACFAAYIRRKKRLDPLPLLVVQPEQVAPHHASPNHFADSESATDSADNGFIGFRP